jgi:signal peptidase I
MADGESQPRAGALEARRSTALAPPAETDSASALPPTEALPHESHAPGVSFHVVETLQTVLTALILAFIFRAYLIEAFIIPTGSMAESLLGEHGTRICAQCGWEYDFGPDPHRSGAPPGQAFSGGIDVRCPNCHATAFLESASISAKAGDRILVHKWPYVFGGWLGPKRWDAIVFKDPHDPTQNFIKRLVGLPGDQIQIIDGDLYIRSLGERDFHIARKTQAAQSVLWFVVFDQAHVPVAGPTPPVWAVEGDGADQAWGRLENRVIRFEPVDSALHAIRFAPTGRHYLTDVYGYNGGASGALVGDVRIRSNVIFGDGDGLLRWDITRDGRMFSATLKPAGELVLTAREPGTDNDVEMSRTQIPEIVPKRRFELAFSHLDYRVFVSVDGREVLSTTDAQYSPQVEQLQKTRTVNPVGIRVQASDGPLELHGLRIDRDVHYIGYDVQRAMAGTPFTVGPDEYFVLGDNSPLSEDSRRWRAPPEGSEPGRGDLGPHLRDRYARGDYHIGTVPADQIVGRAFFVYLPALLPADDRGRWRVVPDIGRSRFVR